MNSDKIKSLLRHLFTFLGTFGALIGLGSLVPAIQFINVNLDAIWAAITTVISIVTTLIAFFSPSTNPETDELESRFTVAKRIELQAQKRKAA